MRFVLSDQTLSLSSWSWACFSTLTESLQSYQCDPEPGFSWLWFLSSVSPISISPVCPPANHIEVEHAYEQGTDGSTGCRTRIIELRDCGSCNKLKLNPGSTEKLLWPGLRILSKLLNKQKIDRF